MSPVLVNVVYVASEIMIISVNWPLLAPLSHKILYCVIGEAPFCDAKVNSVQTIYIELCEVMLPLVRAGAACGTF